MHALTASIDNSSSITLHLTTPQSMNASLCCDGISGNMHNTMILPLKGTYLYWRKLSPPKHPACPKLCTSASGIYIKLLCGLGLLKCSGCPLLGKQINWIKSFSESTNYSITKSLFYKSEYAKVSGVFENVGVPLLSTWNNVGTPK